MNELNIYGSPGEYFITGYHGCKCHPFKSWDELKSFTNKKLTEGLKFKNRCNGNIGIITKINKTGHIDVTYEPGNLPMHNQSIHKTNIILI